MKVTFKLWTFNPLRPLWCTYLSTHLEYVTYIVNMKSIVWKFQHSTVVMFNNMQINKNHCIHLGVIESEHSHGARETYKEKNKKFMYALWKARQNAVQKQYYINANTCINTHTPVHYHTHSLFIIYFSLSLILSFSLSCSRINAEG